jgi:hypothetical protein
MDIGDKVHMDAVTSGLADACKIKLPAAEDRELYMLAQTFCDQAIGQGKQEEARKAIALMIACEGAIHVVS